MTQVSACIFTAVAGLVIFLSAANPAAAAPKKTGAGTDAIDDGTPTSTAGQKLFPQYAGSASCQTCHADEYRLWRDSNHGLAERLLKPARDRAAFDRAQPAQASWSNGVATVTATGLSGRPEPHAVVRVIGNDPLRQYLVAFPGGRLQTLAAAYDPHSNQWFDVSGDDGRQPGEWGHWTGRGMNWNSMCATCHNTRLQKNYNAATDTFHTTMAEMSVGCEACHGPLQSHNDWQKKFGRTGGKDPTLVKLTRAQTVDNCGFCHSLRTDLTGDFKPGDDFSDECGLLTVDAGERYYADGQIRGEDYEYGSFLSSRMHASGVACMDCHDPHTAKVRLPGNVLCLKCHGGGNPKAPVIDPVAHSHHQVRGYDAAGKLTVTNLALYDGKNFKETGGECINCHMSQTVYMQRHSRHDHGFTSPDPLLTKQSGIPNACNRCHQDKDADWALKFCDTWYGTKMERPARRRAQIIARAQHGDPAAADGLLSLLKTEDIPYWRAVESDLLLPWADRPDATAVLLAGLQNTNALVRAASARALEPALTAEVTGALQARLDDPVRNVRIAAAWSLRNTVDTNSATGIELQHHLDLNADEPVGQLNEGNYDFARGDLPSAARHFQKAVDWDARSAPFHQSLAVVLSELNRPQEAVATLEQAVHFSPEDAESHYQLGLAYNGVGNLTNALAQLVETVRLDPDHVAAWYNLGLAQSASGQTDAAVVSLSRAESLAPADTRIPYARATILARRGRTEEAIRELNRALENDPANADARHLLQILSRQTPPTNQAPFHQ